MRILKTSYRIKLDKNSHFYSETTIKFYEITFSDQKNVFFDRKWANCPNLNHQGGEFRPVVSKFKTENGQF